MKLRFGIGTIGLALLLAGCGDKDADNAAVSAPAEPVAAVPPPEGSNWTEVVTETPDGGYLMGNPNAPVKLLEYASYTCPHCAEFSEKASEPLKDYVRSGRVSWEFRPFAIFPTDPGITLLVRCHGPAASFMLTEQIYAEQEQWAGRMRELSDAQAQQLQAMPRQQQVVALVGVTGLDQFFRQRGMPQAKVESCLADQQGLERVAEITQVGSTQYDVSGTPTFFINGQKIANASSWETLEPALRTALGQ